MMLSDEEKTNLIAQYTFGRDINAFALVAEVERAVLAKASQQVQGERFGNTGHGHVWERPDGMKARCGGVGLCSQCKSDLESFNAAKAMPAPKQEPVGFTIDKLKRLSRDLHACEYDSIANELDRKIRQLIDGAPPQAAAIPDWLMEMSEQMRIQDNRGTSHPFFQVRCKRYIVTEQGYNEAGYELCTDDGVVYRSYAAEEDDLEKLLIEDYPEFCEQWRIDEGDETVDDAISSFDPTEDDLPEGVRLVYVQETEEIVSTHLTEVGARQFIRRKQHDYPKLYTYAESAYWSPQLRQLQDWIISLSAALKPEGRS